MKVTRLPSAIASRHVQLKKMILADVKRTNRGRVYLTMDVLQGEKRAIKKSKNSASSDHDKSVLEKITSSHKVNEGYKHVRRQL